MKLKLVIVFTIIAFQLNAQYKKASFFNKTGRTYDLNTTIRIQSGERGSNVGIGLGWGKEKSNKRIHHWYDVEYNLGHTIKYNTFYSGTNIAAKVTGKTSKDWVFRYNWSYFLANNSNTDNKVLPFVNLGVGASFSSHVAYESFPQNNSSFLTREPVQSSATLMLNTGLGTLYKLNEGIALKVSANYNFVSNDDSEGREFLILANHIYFKLGLRFLIEKDED